MQLAGSIFKAQPPHLPEVLLYSQLANPSGTAHMSHAFPDFQYLTNRAADDFVVGAFGWTVQEVFVDGVNSCLAAVDVTFLTNSGVLPGVPVVGCDYPNLTTFTSTAGDLTITLSPPCALPGGTFWVSVRCQRNYSAGPAWLWAEQSLAAGSPYAWENPGGGWGIGCTTWSTGSGCLGPGDEKGFALSGTGLTNVAFGKPVTITTNGADDPCTGCGHEAADVTDGSLAYTPVSSDVQDGVVGYQNNDFGQLMELSVTIDLGGPHLVSAIRYNMGDVQLASAWGADEMITPLGTISPLPGVGSTGAWTEHAGSFTASSVTITLRKTRTSTVTDWLFVGEIQIYGTSDIIFRNGFD